MPRRSPIRRAAGASQQVGARLKHKRREAGLTLEAVSDLTAISISSLSRLEHGRYQLTLEQFVALATALRCPTTELLAACTKVVGSEGPA